MTGAVRWDSGTYLRFDRERSLPSADLASRVELESPTTVVDLGCGPGNSTAVLQRRWPRARLEGVDSSPEMLSVARAALPGVAWVEEDLRRWQPESRRDLLFSNAALQWIPDHPRELRRLWSFVAPGGALAFQVPARPAPPPAWIEAWNVVRRRPRWARLPLDDLAQSSVLSCGEYYDLFVRDARRVDLWDTEYQHVLAGPEAIVAWVQGTSLRPSLARLAGESERQDLLHELGTELERTYPRRASGSVLFPFLRRFVVAYR